MCQNTVTQSRSSLPSLPCVLLRVILRALGLRKSNRAVCLLSHYRCRRLHLEPDVIAYWDCEEILDPLVWWQESSLLNFLVS